MEAFKWGHPAADRRLVAGAVRHDVDGRAGGGSRAHVAADSLRAGRVFSEDVQDDRHVLSVAGHPAPRVQANSSTRSIVA